MTTSFSGFSAGSTDSAVSTGLCAVDVMELIADLCGHFDPCPLLEGLVAVVAAGEAHKLDVLHAAGHGEPARHETVLAGAVGLADLCEELNGLAAYFWGSS